MSIWNLPEKRSQANWDILRDMELDGQPTFLANTTAKALTLIPVFSATSLIADMFSSLPISGYTTTGGRRVRLVPQPEITYKPHINPVFTRVEWLHQFCTSFLLRGNAYGLITALDTAGRPSKVMWLNPDGVRVDETYSRSKELIYEYNGTPIDQTTLIHIPWYPQPGSVVGLSPISAFRSVIETGGSAVNYGHNWFGNGARPSGHLKYGNGPLDADVSAEAKARFKAAVRGNDIFVSGNDWEWESLSIKPEEAQFLESIKASATQIAAIFRVDPEDIGGETGSSLTYSTLELRQIHFQIRTLMPIYTRLEHHINRLFPDYEYVKFNPDAIVRADLMTRTQAEEIQLRSFIRTNEEVRALEELAPLSDAEIKKAVLLYGKTPAPTNPGGVTQPKGGA